MSNLNTKYAGAQYVRNHINSQISQLGSDVADLLGELFLGIYHIDEKKLKQVDWANPNYISITMHHSFSTFDSADLTQLVFLARHLSVRVLLKPCNQQFLKLFFYPRDRNGTYTERHPTPDEAVANFKASTGIVEKTS